MSESLNTVDLIVKLHSIKAGVNTRDWYDILTLVIQAIASIATFGALLAALWPQIKAGTFKLRDIVYFPLQKILVFRWKSYNDERKIVVKYIFLNQNYDIISELPVDWYIPFGVISHPLSFTNQNFDRHKIKDITLLKLEFDDTGYIIRPIKKRHKTQIEKFINQK